MLPGDRLVCAFVDPQTVGSHFAKWPLHVTIVPWLRLPDSSETIVRGLAHAVAGISPFEAQVEGDVLFGPRHNRPAKLVLLPTPFSEIEQRVRAYFHKKRAWLVDETTKRRREFRPHVTVQGNTSLQDGDTFWCDRLYIVEQRGEYKEIVGEVQLGGE